MKFRTVVSEANFLFGEEIPAYIDEMHKELNWLIGQFNPAKERFKKF